MNYMLIAIFVISFLAAYYILCLAYYQVLKRLGVKMDYRDLFLFFLDFYGGPSLSTDIGKNAKSRFGRVVINFFGDLGVNAVYFLILLGSAAAGFAGVYFANKSGL